MFARAAPLGVLLLLAAEGGAAATDAGTVDLVDAAPTWTTNATGGRFRVRFDPGARLMLGGGAEALIRDLRAPALALEVGLFLRSERPAPGWDVHWRRNHELAHLRVVPGDGTRGATVDGALYRGIFLRQSRQGTLTLPMSPPLALSLPFDIGLLAEVGHMGGALAPRRGGPPVAIDVGVVHGEVLADFWRSHQPGCWLTLGIGGRYQVGLRRDDAGAWLRDHQVSPMSTVAVALHAERADGLAAAGARAEASHRWSSQRGWERAFRLDADAEVTPLAVNDRPVALFATLTADAAPDRSQPELRVTAGIRFSQPLR